MLLGLIAICFIALGLYSLDEDAGGPPLSAAPAGLDLAGADDAGLTM